MSKEAHSIILPMDNFSHNPIISGIMICHVQGGQLHCGIAYKYDNTPMVIHLAWHRDLHNEEDINTLEGYYFTEHAVHPIRQKMVSTRCNRIAKLRDQRIPYGLLFENGSFDEDGILHLGDSEHGLTCATFVIAVYQSCGINLFDIQNWPSRPEDKNWHEWILSILCKDCKAGRVTKEHVQNVTDEIGCARFRPEEVAASITFPLPPADFQQISERGSLIRNLLVS